MNKIPLIVIYPLDSENPSNTNMHSGDERTTDQVFVPQHLNWWWIYKASYLESLPLNIIIIIFYKVIAVPWFDSNISRVIVLTVYRRFEWLHKQHWIFIEYDRGIFVVSKSSGFWVIAP